MLSDTVNPQPSLARLAAWHQAIHTRLQALAQEPATTLGTLEAALESAAQELLGDLLQPAMQTLAKTVALLCPVCQAPLQIEARNKARTVTHLWGDSRLVRDYGWCGRCQDWFYPADHRLGLSPYAPASPRVQEIAALMTLKMPSAQAEAVAARVTGRSRSRSTLDREARRQGLRAQALREAEVAWLQTPQGLARLAAQAKPRLPNQPFTLIIQVDAFNIRERDHWGQTASRRKQGLEVSRWHWVYVGTCFRLDQRVQTASGRPIITERGYVATRLGVEAFGQQMYAEAVRRGLTQADKVLVIADGALWIWHWAEDRLEFATHLVDLWHVKQHLWAVAHELHGPDSPLARRWLAPLFTQLETRNDGAAKVIARLECLRQTTPSLTDAQQAALDKEINYLKANQNRMNYAAARAAGEPVGSGPVESTCHQYQCRFKRTGQFWSLAGDEPLLALETLYRNERWHQLFPHAQSPAQVNTN
jgi:hypothetical protein